MRDYEDLPPKQRRFIDEYLVDCNASRAALVAGFSEKTAYSQGQRFLKNPETSRIIKQRQKETSEKLALTKNEILASLEKVIEKFLLDGFNTANALRAISIYNKMLGYDEATKIEHSGSGIVINVIKPKDE